MRFLRKNKVQKTIVILSDLHLGAGQHVGERHNPLEDFHYDRELVDFLDYYAQGPNGAKEVELIINGDFLDFLAVPYVEYFDDEFWSEEAALAKFDLIYKAHEEVFNALREFVSQKNRKFVYILGNHDGEMILPRLKERFMDIFPKEIQERVIIYNEGEVDYAPVEGVLLKHGHEYERAHQYETVSSLHVADDGKRYFVPPWGSYYVTRVINKFKQERHFINAVRPIRKFIIDGLIYDPLFTLRFLFGNIFYFVMVRVISYFFLSSGPREILALLKKELFLFQDYEEITRETILSRSDIKALIVGHTHLPQLRSYFDGSLFINTGTWTRMVNLDYGRPPLDKELPYAQVDVLEKKKSPDFSHLDISLYSWIGKRELPFEECNV